MIIFVWDNPVCCTKPARYFIIPLVEKRIDITSYPAVNVLDLLLQDKSAKKNIIWATDTYEELGEGFTDKAQMDAGALLRRPELICPRIQKPQEAQAQRTRKKAEVFTPAWLCNRMNNYCDDGWFGKSGVFNTENTENGGHTWTVSEGKIEFPEEQSWWHYVDSRRLEITCGEAPYLVSRYDVSTGELIVPPVRRIGFLDRKLRVVNENTGAYEEWLKWTIRAFEASYGYEYQGDNVLIARINLLLTFTDYYEERWGQKPDEKLLRHTANKIAWNIWQMDGLKGTVPLGKPYEKFRQITFFEMFGMEDGTGPEAVPCRIQDWRRKTPLRFMDLKEEKAMGKKLFDYVIGNPPYQEDVENKGDRANPVYDKFMDAVYEIADRVELIHPARFLFNAGQTSKAWNEKMLNDEHLKVLHYEQKSDKVFPNTDIKGGVAITLHDKTKKYGAIGVFTSFKELNEITKKVSIISKTSIDSLISPRGTYRFSERFFSDYPFAMERLGKGSGNMIVSNAFTQMPEAFLQSVDNESGYIKLLGRIKSDRVYRYLKRDYLLENEYIDAWKVMLPEANGSGAIGEVLSTPLIGAPLIGATDTFISIGPFSNEIEAENVFKYIKTKFARTMLGIKKVTQHNPKAVWKYVPLQEFTPPHSDIDWSKSVHEIDLQLYRKYGLDEKEIAFIESHVKEMA